MEHYGYGILKNDGTCAQYCGRELDAANHHAEWMNETWPETSPHRVIDLFYKDEEQS